MKQILDLFKDILDNGNDRGDRTGTGTRSIFGRQLRFNLQDGFPLVTTRKMYIRGIIEELLWFLSGSTDNNKLTEKKVSLWSSWATEKGDLGPIYGKQWRSWSGKVQTCNPGKKVWNYLKTNALGLVFPGYVSALRQEPIDQISELIKGLKEKPFSRRHIVSAWNVADLPDESISPQANVENGKMSLAPCHVLVQFYVTELTYQERNDISLKRSLDLSNTYYHPSDFALDKEGMIRAFDNYGVPTKKLSCQLFQR